MSLFLEDSPREQLPAGVFFFLGGVVILPAMLSLLMPAVQWMNSAWSDAIWSQTGWRWTRGLMVFGCAWIALAGAERLLVFSLAKAGVIGSPW